MISHHYKVIYIHIPKCAGSSIERYFGAKPFNWKEPNYDKLVGWDPKRKIHLQHATPRQLLELDLITESVWDDYYKFTIIRDPWSRLVSSFVWLKHEHSIKGSFSDFLLRTGQFERILDPSIGMETRSEHLKPQMDYITLNGKNCLDYICHFETLEKDIQEIFNKIGISGTLGYYDKKGRYKRGFHYSELFDKKTYNLVRELYPEDLERLGYKFVDKRSWLAKQLWPIRK